MPLSVHCGNETDNSERKTILLFTLRVHEHYQLEFKSNQTHFKFASWTLTKFIKKLSFFFRWIQNKFVPGNAPWWKYCAFWRLVCCACIMLCFGWVKPFYTISIIFCWINSAYSFYHFIIFSSFWQFQTFLTRWCLTAVKVLNHKTRINISTLVFKQQ